MNLLQILSKYKKEDAEQMEQESLVSKDNSVGLSSTEKWEIEKEEKDFFSFYKEMNAQSIEVEK